MPEPKVSRRTLLGGAAALPLGAAVPSHRGNVFTLGVASGDPLPDGVIIWTRLATDPTAPDGGMPDRTVAVEGQGARPEGVPRPGRHGPPPPPPGHRPNGHLALARPPPARPGTSQS